MKLRNKIVLFVTIILTLCTIVGCSQAERVSSNLSKEADNFNVVRQLTVINCIEGDVLYHNYTGKLAHQDVIVISNCGSYSLVMKPPFILPNFPVLDISEGKTEVIKRAENFDDLFHTFNF